MVEDSGAPGENMLWLSRNWHRRCESAEFLQPGSFCRDNMHSMSFRRRVYGNASSPLRRVFVNRNRHRRRNRGKYTSIYITAGCWLVTLSRTVDDSMICRSVTVPCQIYPAAVLAGALTRKTPDRSFAIGALTRVVTLDYQSAAIVMRHRFVLRLVMPR